MQIQWPQTARHLGVYRSVELLNPCLNIALGATYLRELLDRFDQDETRALAAYNYGPTRIGTSRAIPAGARRYVERVRQNQQRLQSFKTRTVAATKSSVVTRFTSRYRANAYARSSTRTSSRRGSTLSSATTATRSSSPIPRSRRRATAHS